MPKTLLLADDSVVIQKLVGLSFANEDIELVTTDNGDDALTRARQLRPDLVLADVVMPGKNGYEVCQAIKNDPDLNTTPVLLLTGTFEAFDETRSREVGSDGHITKPFEAQGLVDRVTDLLSKPRPKPVAAPAPAPEPAPAATMPEAAPAAAAPVPEAAPAATMPELPSEPVAEGHDAYDFFEDDVHELAAPEATPAAASSPPAAAASEDAFAFAEDLDPLASSGSDPDTLDTNFDLDSDGPDALTIAAPAMAPPPVPVDAASPDATRVDMGETMIADDFAAPTAAPVASLDERLSAPVSASLPEPPRAAPPAAPDPNETMIADDLFADAAPSAQMPPPVPAAAPEPTSTAPELPPALDSGFEFGAEAAAPPSTPPLREERKPVIEPPAPPAFEAPAAPAPQPSLAAPSAPAEPSPFARAAAMADATPPAAVSFSDVGEDITSPSPEPPDLDIEPMEAAGDDPLASMDAPSFDGPALSAPSWDAPEGDGPDLADAAESTHSGYDVSSSDLGDPLADSASGMPGMDATPASPEPIALASQSAGSPPEISPMMRDQIHETLEKVAWEAFADVSDTIVKQVLQRVESVVWEVVPQMAEALIQEEIRRMKGED